MRSNPIDIEKSCRACIINQIIGVSKYFRDRGYPKTAEAILNISQKLQKKRFQLDCPQTMRSVSELLEEEFVNTLDLGQDYRRRCFDEIFVTLFAAAARIWGKFDQVTRATVHFLDRINEMDQSIMPVAALLPNFAKPNRSTKDKEVGFHLNAYIYLIGVEGIFDELAKMLYFFSVVSKEYIPKFEDLDKMEVWDILKEFKYARTKIPVFLENWEEKRHLRNSIGHARAHYDAKKDEIRFEDFDQKTKSLFHKTISMGEFMEIHMQIIDTIDAFRFSMALLHLFELLAYANAQ